MATVKELEAKLDALMALMAQQASDGEDAPKPKAKGNAAKLKAIDVPTWTHTDDDGTKYRFTMAFQSNPKNGEPTIYRRPRVLIESKTVGQDDFRKVCTVLPELLTVIAAMPEVKLDAFQTDPREA